MRSSFATLGGLGLLGALACTGGAREGVRSDGDAGTIPTPEGSRSEAGSPPHSPGVDAGGGTDAAVRGPPPTVYAVTISGELFGVDLVARTVTSRGYLKDNGCNHAAPYDIAVDDRRQGFLSEQTRFYRVDLDTVTCAPPGPSGPLGYPGTLAFVPIGTLDPTQQVLVGYVGSSYRRIDPTTGASTEIGSIGGGHRPISTVATRSGRLFVGDVGNGCSDCLVEVDPTTGAVERSYGSLGRNVGALVAWDETLYGFDSRRLFSVTATPGASTAIVTDVGDLDREVSFSGAAAAVVTP